MKNQNEKEKKEEARKKRKITNIKENNLKKKCWMKRKKR